MLLQLTKEHNCRLKAEDLFGRPRANKSVFFKRQNTKMNVYQDLNSINVGGR